jgi:hypothetical protein
MVIEYIGELIRQSVADDREKKYTKIGTCGEVRFDCGGGVSFFLSFFLFFSLLIEIYSFIFV